MRQKDIIFTDTMGIPKEYHPKPASKFIPEWEKKASKKYWSWSNYYKKMCACF
jgi:hypothetical protein